MTNISAAEIARCGGMPPATRRQWGNAGLLELGSELTEHDAIETAVAACLIEATTTQRARKAFEALRADLRQAVLAGNVDLWAIVPEGGREFRLATSDQEALALAGQMLGARGPVWPVSLKQSIADARRRYQESISSRPGGKVKQLPSRAAPQKRG